jgi:DNA-binding CsgD family transcriptional regulator
LCIWLAFRPGQEENERVGPLSAASILEDIDRTGHRGLEKDAYCRAVGERLRRAVGFDGSCWHTIDPATMLITSHQTERLPDRFPVLAANEYLTDDLNKFSDLAQRRHPVAVLGRTTRGRPERSARYRELLAPNGLGAELRVSFVIRGACWGSLILVRESGRPDFDEEQAAFLSAASSRIAEGLRSSIAMSSAVGDELPAEPGLVLVDPRGELERRNGSAQRWLEELGAPAAGGRGQALPVAVLSAASAALHGDRARSRLRGRSGAWLTVTGARLSGQPPAASVLIQAARPAEISPLILAAYGLTPREREVAEHVLRHRSTTEISKALFISPHTVQDHLKAVFEKAAVRSRKQLAGRVFFDHYLPRILSERHPTAEGAPRG